MFEPKVGNKYIIYYNGEPSPEQYAGVALLYAIHEFPGRGEDYTDYFLEFEEWYPPIDDDEYPYTRIGIYKQRNSYDRTSWGRSCLFLPPMQRILDA